MKDIKCSTSLLVLLSFAFGVYCATEYWLSDRAGVDYANELGYPLASTVSLDGEPRRLIGPVADVVEDETGLNFVARVDTGAKRSSLHVCEWEVIDGSSEMSENVGKSIRFRLENRQGNSEWLEREIAEVALIRTSERAELRYLVPLTFEHAGVEREVLVSLNDRSQMSFAMLLGRNFLAEEFVVDVAAIDPMDHLLAGTK